MAHLVLMVGPAGDLFITFSIAPHPQFKRLGNDLYTNATIDLYTAVLGGETTIGNIERKSETKSKFRNTIWHKKSGLKGKGFPVYKKEGGILVICMLPTI
ncbi:MAG: DnaJ C-terminal domain-containing protein [Ferruginibacter sp.]